MLKINDSDPKPLRSEVATAEAIGLVDDGVSAPDSTVLVIDQEGTIVMAARPRN